MGYTLSHVPSQALTTLVSVSALLLPFKTLEKCERIVEYEQCGCLCLSCSMVLRMWSVVPLMTEAGAGEGEAVSFKKRRGAGLYRDGCAERSDTNIYVER